MTGPNANGSAATAAYAGRRVLVLGASGFIGGWVVQALARAGAVTHAVVRNPVHADRLRRAGAAAVVAVDLTSPGVVARLLEDTSPAVTFNLAGYGVDHGEHDVALMSALNSRLVEHLCDAAKELPAVPDWIGLRLVQAGSALEYGPIGGTISDDTDPRPDTDYGRTKLSGSKAVEAATRSSELRACVVRLFTVYGPGEHKGRLLPSLIEAARSGTSVRLTTGEQPRDFTYIEEAVEGLLRAGRTRGASGMMLNVATGHLTTVRTFAEEAARILGIPPHRLEFGAIPHRGGEMFHGAVDASRAARILGWSPTMPIGEGIRRTWEQERHSDDADRTGS